MFLDKISKKLLKAGLFGIEIGFENGAVLLTGELDSWEEIVLAGQLAVDTKSSRGVINNIKLKGFEEPKMRIPELNDLVYDGKKVDVLVIGGGIVGCSILRELTKWNLSALLVEKEYDVAVAQSSRNDGEIHPGIDLNPDCIKVKYNCRGNKMYPRLAKDLGFHIKQTGQYVLYTKPIGSLVWPLIKSRAKKNDIAVEKLSQEELKLRQPNVSDELHGATYYPNVYVVSPYEVTIAFAESAIINGAEIALNTAVLGMEHKDKKIYSVKTNRGTIYPKVVVNAAGVFSDKIAEMAGDRFFTIHPRKGEEMILDKKASALMNTVMGRFDISHSASHTKGGGILITADNNLLLGPNAVETPLREDTATTPEGIDMVVKKQQAMMPKISKGSIITYFAGVRASTYEEQFVIERSKKVENFVQAAGIQSPGITAAPAIAEDIAKYCINALGGVVKPNENFNPIRKPIPKIRELSLEERDKIIKERADYGVIVCRCEEISRGEIIDALNAPLKVPTIDAVKRRVRAGMGRCQGGFCSPQIVKIIAENEGISIDKVAKKQQGSEILVAKNKGNK